MDEPIVRGSFLTTFGDYLRHCGGNPNATFRRAGFSREWLADRNRELPLNAVSELFELAAMDVEDRCFGLNYAAWLEPGHFGMLDHLMLSASNAREALQLAADYAETTISPMHFEFRRAGPLMTFAGRLPISLTAPSAQFVDFLAGVLVLRIRLAAGAEWAPEHVSLPRRAPLNTQQHQRTFGPRLAFGSLDLRLSLGRDELERPMPGGWPGLGPTIRAAADQALAEVRAVNDFVGRVRRVIADRLAREEDVRLAAVAASLGSTSRSLQWQLSRHNTTYEAILTDVRFSIAISLLRDTTKPMTEICRRLGFSEGSAFTRWSKTHFEMAPSAYRRTLRAQG